MLEKGLRGVSGAFRSVPDPEVCYLDPARWQASARIFSGIGQDDNLFILTGQEEIGKTTLLSHLAVQLPALDGVLPLCPTHVASCRPGAMPGGVPEAWEPELELAALAAAPLKAAKRLQELVEGGQSPVLLLDEGDLLSDDTLEAIIILTRLRAADRRLLSVSMAAHPSILGRIASITSRGERWGPFARSSSSRWPRRTLADSFVIGFVLPAIPRTPLSRRRSWRSHGTAGASQALWYGSVGGELKLPSFALRTR